MLVKTFKMLKPTTEIFTSEKPCCYKVSIQVKKYIKYAITVLFKDFIYLLLVTKP